MNYGKILSLATAAILTATSCSSPDRQTAPVPRPTAYPRVAELGQEYFSPDSIALRFDVNTAAKINRRSANWFDIIYPSYDAAVFITITRSSSDSITSVIENRRHRMLLNIGDNGDITTSELNSGQFSSFIYKSPAARSTPLQFISSDGHSWVVSGTVFFKNATGQASVDSLSPMVSQIERDINHSLNNLSLR